MHCGYVVKVEKLRPHTNADRLQIATFFGNDTVVDLNTKVGDIGVYFPTDLQLSVEYCAENNLVRKKDENGNEIGGYLDPDKRNIKAIKLRGEKSDGVFMPIHSFDFCYDGKCAVNELSIGDTISVVNGHEICCKYIPRTNRRHGHPTNGNKTRKVKVEYAPLFEEHADTEQLAYNHGAFKNGDRVQITLKMHGTSQRTAYLPVLKGYKRTLWDKITRKTGTPIYEYDYVSGTRRVVMEDFEGGNSFYGSNAFRESHHNAFVGKLMRGETVYYEVVGFTDAGAPIMASATNDKLGKDFVKMYGKETVFSYGCHPDGGPLLHGRDDAGQFAIKQEMPQSDLYVYRMTITNEDGFVVEYTPEFMRYRCEQMGVKTVQEFDTFTIPAKEKKPGEYVQRKAEKYYDGTDPVGKTHIREGVVCRILNRPKFCAYKHKNFPFKVLSGIAVESADTSNMSEDILSEL